MQTVEIANQIIQAANRDGWKIYVRGSVLTITKHFTPNDNNAFCECDGQYYGILSILPSTNAGSVWGTDGGGMGALSALKDGLFVANKSGGNKRVLACIQKTLQRNPQ